MKKILLKTVYLLFSLVTFAQNNVSKCNYNDSIFKLHPNEMAFDIEKYKVELKKGIGRKIIIDNENYQSYFNGDTTGVHYVQISKKLKINKTIAYYPNGNIESFDMFYTPSEGSSVRINKRFYYNPNGTLNEEEDIDKGYKICYDEVIPIAKKIIGVKKIKEYELTFSVGRTDLNEFPKGKAKWYVGVKGNDKFQKKINPSNSYEYVIDGITGKLIGILKPKFIP
jgi:hypothetical protein